MSLNSKQRVVLTSGLLTVLALALYPPWRMGGRGVFRAIGHAFLFAPPAAGGAVVVDYGRLSLYWLVVAGLTGLASYALRSRGAPAPPA